MCMSNYMCVCVDVGACVQAYVCGMCVYVCVCVCVWYGKTWSVHYVGMSTCQFIPYYARARMHTCMLSHTIWGLWTDGAKSGYGILTLGALVLPVTVEVTPAWSLVTSPSFTAWLGGCQKPFLYSEYSSPSFWLLVVAKTCGPDRHTPGPCPCFRVCACMSGSGRCWAVLLSCLTSAASVHGECEKEHLSQYYNNNSNSSHFYSAISHWQGLAQCTLIWLTFGQWNLCQQRPKRSVTWVYSCVFF